MRQGICFALIDCQLVLPANGDDASGEPTSVEAWQPVASIPRALFGADHDRYAVRKGLVEGGADVRLSDLKPPFLFGYVNQQRFHRGSPGLRWPPARDAWITIMAYHQQCSDYRFYCDKIAFFSNPNLTHFGDPAALPATTALTASMVPLMSLGPYREYSHLVSHNLQANCLRSGVQRDSVCKHGPAASSGLTTVVRKERHRQLDEPA